MSEKGQFYKPTEDELPKPRDKFVVNTGDTETVEKEINRFFSTVLDTLGFDQKATEAFAERDSFTLHRTDSEGNPYPIDDRITLLIVRGRVVASILERRDDLNYVEVAGASYLTPDSVRGLGERRVR
jgi:hypothetical protein